MRFLAEAFAGLFCAAAFLIGGLFLFSAFYIEMPAFARGLVALMSLGFFWYGFEQARSILDARKYLSEHVLKLDNDGVRIYREFFNYDDVSHVRFVNIVTRKSVNFISSGQDQSVILELTMKNTPKVQKFVSGPTVVTYGYGSFGASSSKRLISKAETILQNTFQNRVSEYLKSMQQREYFVYDGTKFHASGKVEHPDGEFVLHGRNLKRVPFVVYHEVPSGSFFRSSKKFAISTEVDADVFFFLLDKLFGIRWK